MKKFLNILMLSCRRSSELIEKKLASKLTTIESIQLAMHTSMCDACKSWEKQSKNLDHFINPSENAHKQNSNTEIDSLSDEAKNVIIRKIEEQK